MERERLDRSSGRSDILKIRDAAKGAGSNTTECRLGQSNAHEIAMAGSIIADCVYCGTLGAEIHAIDGFGDDTSASFPRILGFRDLQLCRQVPVLLVTLMLQHSTWKISYSSAAAGMSLHGPMPLRDAFVEISLSHATALKLKTSTAAENGSMLRFHRHWNPHRRTMLNIADVGVGRRRHGLPLE